MPKQRSFWLIAFIICVIGDLSAIGLSNTLLEMICKPLLMPTLFGYFFFSISKRRRHRAIPQLVGYGLLFSWLGDISLMFDENSIFFFISGLAFFLLAHFQYIRIFIYWSKPNGRRRSKQYLASFSSWKSAVIGITLIAYGCWLYITLFDSLDDIIMKIAVFIYAATITAMALFSLSTRHTKPKRVLFSLFTGALFFIASDSMIAINKFLTEIPYAQLLIISTYAIAQFFIVEGCIKGMKEERQ